MYPAGKTIIHILYFDDLHTKFIYLFVLLHQVFRYTYALVLVIVELSLTYYEQP